MKTIETKWDLEEINFARKCVGLPSLKQKQKRCSKCTNIFFTTTHNICCDNCRRENHHIFKYLEAHSDKKIYV